MVDRRLGRRKLCAVHRGELGGGTGAERLVRGRIEPREERLGMDDSRDGGQVALVDGMCHEFHPLVGLLHRLDVRADLSRQREPFRRLARRMVERDTEPARRRQHPAAKTGRTEFTDNVRMKNGKPTRVVDAEEFIAAAEKAYARVAPTIDRRLAELNGYRDTLANRVKARRSNEIAGIGMTGRS